MIGRRRFVVSALAAAAGTSVPLALAASQSSKTYRIAFVNLGPAAPNAPNLAAFRDGLREFGYVEGRNLEIDFFWGEQRVDRLPALVSDALARKPDVVFSSGGPPMIRAVKAATTTVPVVFITGDPIEEGVVRDLARPGGNLTGFALLQLGLDAKRLELLREVLPKARRVAVLWNPAGIAARTSRTVVEEAAAKLDFVVSWHAATDDAGLDRALAETASERVDALTLVADPVIGFRRTKIVEFATRHRLPGVYLWREFVEEGGLMSYGTSLTAVFRRAAHYVDKILRGARPADLPIEQAATFEIVVNARTAETLGVALPKSVLGRADVIH